MTGVRIREDTFEGRCDYCKEWWPLTFEHWPKSSGLRRCRACKAIYSAAWQRGQRMTNPELVRAAQRERYAMRPERRAKKLASSAAWREKNREHLREYNRAYQAAHREQARAYARDYYAEAGDVVKAKKRQAYAERKAA